MEEIEKLGKLSKLEKMGKIEKIGNREIEKIWANRDNIGK